MKKSTGFDKSAVFRRGSYYIYCFLRKSMYVDTYIKLTYIKVYRLIFFYSDAQVFCYIHVMQQVSLAQKSVLNDYII